MNDLEQKLWESCDYTLPETVKTLLTSSELQLIYYLTSTYYSGKGAIIDAGPFLGGSTVAMLDGLAANSSIEARDNTINAYDLFEVIDDSNTWGQIGLELGPSHNFLSEFTENLGSRVNQVAICQGDILEKKWEGGPIEILFIDIAKTPEILDHIEKTFYPHLIPGKSIVIQQDLQYPGCPWIHMSMHLLRDYFITLDYLPNNTAAYLYKSEIPSPLLGALDYRGMQTERRMAGHFQAIADIPVCGQLMLRLDEVIWLLEENETELAVEKLHEIQSLTKSDLSIYAQFVSTALFYFPELYSPSASIDLPESLTSDYRLSLASQMSPDERLVLYTLVRSLRPKRMLEVGRARGGSTFIIAEAIKHLEGAEFVSMDPNNWPEHSIPTILRHNLEESYGVHFIDEYCPWALPAAKELAGDDFDVIFLDGDHSYDAVKRDLLGLLPFLVSGGYILMHDSHFHPLRRAINEVVEETGIIDCGNLVTECDESLSDTLVDGAPSYYGGMHLLHKPSASSKGGTKNRYREIDEQLEDAGEARNKEGKTIKELQQQLKSSYKDLEREKRRRFWPKLKRSILKRLNLN